MGTGSYASFGQRLESVAAAQSEGAAECDIPTPDPVLGNKTSEDSPGRVRIGSWDLLLQANPVLVPTLAHDPTRLPPEDQYKESGDSSAWVAYPGPALPWGLWMIHRWTRALWGPRMHARGT